MMYNKKNNLRNDSAVTMVALVVTIIVLLILAGITITLALNNNGIIKRTKVSKNVYEEAEVNDYKSMNELDNEIHKQSNYENTLVNLFKKGTIKVGDYLNYNIPSSGSFTTNATGDDTSNGFSIQTYDVNNNGETIKWRVLGLGDENGKLTLDNNRGINLLIISGSPVQKNIDNNSDNDYDKNPYLYMGKAEGCVNANNILNGISKIYLNNRFASNARSINDEDINTILDIEVNYESRKVYQKSDISNNIDTIRTMGNTYSFNEGDYSANSYINGKRTAIINGEESAKGTGYSYWINSFRDKSIGSTTIGNLLFNQTDMSSNFAKSYWLAQTSIEVSHAASYCIGEVYMESVNLGTGMFYSNGNWYVFGLGVYPIITLKPELTIEDLQVITDRENDWDYKANLYYTGNTDNYETTGTKRTMF